MQVEMQVSPLLQSRMRGSSVWHAFVTIAVFLSYKRRFGSRTSFRFFSKNSLC